jgi:hypothetical protein
LVSRPFWRRFNPETPMTAYTSDILVGPGNGLRFT